MNRMLRNTVVVAVLVTLSFAVVSAQASGNPLSAGEKGWRAGVKNNILRAAEKMPEENYSFKPVPEVRSFGQLLGHIADAQYLFASAVTGQPNASPGVEKNKTTKAELIQALKEAFAYTDKLYDEMTDAKGAEMAKFFGRELPKLTILSINTGHDNEHYGNIVTYMRLKGLVPPSSEPRR